MRFDQVLNDDLGCASYLISDAGQAIVVDPRFDVDIYLALARSASARVIAVVDSHHHADHVSGRGRLAARTGARALHPAAGERAHRIEAGDEVRAGAVVLRALATPGHRPEHLAFAVVDTARSAEPCAVLTGDSLLVGDVARPDLAVEPRDGARALHASVARLLALGDHVELWPGHVGGSLCGGAGLSHKTSSTLGVERRCSASAGLDADAFVARVASVAKAKPPNMARVVELNRGALDGEPPKPPLLDAGDLAGIDLAGVEILDHRDADAFDDGHLRGAALIPAGSRGAGNRAAWATRADRPLLLVGASAADARAFTRKLHAVGLWSIAAITVADPAGWRAARLPVGHGAAMSIETLARRLRDQDIGIVDVREQEEFAAGHVAGSRNLPLATLADGRGVDLPNTPALAVICAGGARAAIGASLLRRTRRHVLRVTGGGVPDLPRLGVEVAR
jgi:glyoxylase-like metal-dependent hydrolase (beta-lactamase superfamily II)/rhodanese-related sulfurtransferase